MKLKKSVDGREWKTLGVVFGNGTSSLLNKYSYTDKSAKSATTYYRIRQVDVNGTAVYSAVKVISETKAASSVSIFASNGKNIVINMNSDARENMQVTVLNTNGQVVNRQTVANASYQVTVPMNTVPSGLYIVQVSDKSGWNEVKKVVL
ncbi:MAG: T9SS type A sorting domain-containing protein [Chitinophagaceae bacterium]|nr:T9SS type A sorting domain-containing protein [Chitinophagaceae bacterium]